MSFSLDKNWPRRSQVARQPYERSWRCSRRAWKLPWGQSTHVLHISSTMKPKCFELLGWRLPTLFPSPSHRSPVRRSSFLLLPQHTSSAERRRASGPSSSRNASNRLQITRHPMPQPLVRSLSSRIALLGRIVEMRLALTAMQSLIIQLEAGPKTAAFGHDERLEKDRIDEGPRLSFSVESERPLPLPLFPVLH